MVADTAHVNVELIRLPPWAFPFVTITEGAELRLSVLIKIISPLRPRISVRPASLVVKIALAPGFLVFIFSELVLFLYLVFIAFFLIFVAVV